jgi:glycosyltransferase involved in cell wall biosynthesis
MANREGLPVKLIRTGKDYCDFLGERTDWAHKNSIELGRVDFKEIPELLALADILIQPGKPDPFNDYRLPSKIPEFLSMGKPVIVPNTNIGRYLTNFKNALITKKGDGLELLSIISNIAKNKTLMDCLSKESRAFALKNFNKAVISAKLDTFYRSLLNKAKQ